MGVEVVKAVPASAVRKVGNVVAREEGSVG